MSNWTPSVSPLSHVQAPEQVPGAVLFADVAVLAGCSTAFVSCRAPSVHALQVASEGSLAAASEQPLLDVSTVIVVVAVPRHLHGLVGLYRQDHLPKHQQTAKFHRRPFTGLIGNNREI